MALLVGSTAYFQTPQPSSPHHPTPSPSPCTSTASPKEEGGRQAGGGDPAPDSSAQSAPCPQPESAALQNGQTGEGTEQAGEATELAGEATEQAGEEEQTSSAVDRGDRAGQSGRTPGEHNQDSTPQCNGHGDETEDSSSLALRDKYVDRVWEEFMTYFLVGSCHIQQAAIFDLATQRPLAASGELQISGEEMERLVASLHHVRHAYRNGVTIGGKSYKVRLADGRNGILARTDSEGCTVCKTHTLIIIGVHDSRGNSRKCNEDVMRLGDFFRKKAL